MLANHVEGLDLTGVPGCAVGWLNDAGQPDFFFSGHVTHDGAAMSHTTVWEAASLTKPVVALLAAAQLASKPDFLDVPLTVTPAAFGAAEDHRWDQLTLRHCLTHTTGLPNWREPGQELRFATDPGQEGYSGEGYELLLAELASRVAPAPVLTALHLTRLGMDSSSFVADPCHQPALAIGHDETGQAQDKQQFDGPRASGSLHTTVVDYLGFLATVAGVRTADDPLMAGAAELRKRSPGGGDTGRTLGWAYSATPQGDVLWQHGDNPGFKHIAAVRPGTGEALVVFTNGDLGQELYRPICKRALQADVW